MNNGTPQCLVCNSTAQKLFTTILHLQQEYQASYYLCGECGFLFVDKPQWINHVYQNNAINIGDTGILSRNLSLAKILSVLIYFLLGKETSCLDYGAGYGILVRLMRDIGFNLKWLDPHCDNLLAKGFEFDKDADNINLVVSLETFEHFLEPFAEIEKLFSISNNIIFSTFPLPHPVPPPEQWWYYGLDHGQHVSFYSHKTLQYIADKYNVSYYTCGYIHMFTTKRFPKVWFKLLVKGAQYGLSAFVRCRMKSKTVEDMESLKSKHG
jgi:hypothetical protein